MEKQPAFFEILPFASKRDEVWADRMALFCTVLLGGMFVCAACVGFVSAVRADFLESTPLWPMLSFKQWLVVFACVCAVLASVVVWSYSSTKTPKDVLSECLPGAVLVARSAGMLSWSCTFEEIQQLTKEPSTWFVEWRTNPFGMHADRLIAHNLAGRTAFKVEFDHLPQEFRFVPWPSPEVAYWKEHTVTVTCKALLPVVTAHVRMGLARASIV